MANRLRPLPTRLLAAATVLAAFALSACGGAEVARADAAAAAGAPAADGVDVALAMEQGDWRAADSALPAAPGGAAPALRDRAMVDWQLGRPAAALAAEQRLLTLNGQGDAAARDALFALARHHARVRKDPLAAHRLLVAAQGPAGCADPAACTLSRQVALALFRLPDAKPEQALALAPVAPKARARWMLNLGDALMVQSDVATVLSALEPALTVPAGANAEVLEAARTLWLASYRWHGRLPGGKGREQWLTLVDSHQLPASLLVSLALAPEVSVQAPLAGRLLELVHQRPNAPDSAAPWWMASLARQGNLEGLQALLRSKPPSNPDAQAAAARWLLELRQATDAEPYLSALEAARPGDAIALALRGLSLQLQGKVPQAEATIGKIAAAGGDRSLAWLILAHAQRSGAAGQPTLLQAAAAAPGAGQRPAARELAFYQLRAQPSPATTVAIHRYARLLIGPQPPASPLAPAAEPQADDARRQLFEALALPTWAEHRAAFLREWADAGLADAEMLRELSRRSVQEGDLSGFLRREAAATAAAATESRELPSRELLADLLAARRGGPWLAAWLRQSGSALPAWQPLPQFDDEGQGWLAATQLLASSFGIAGRALAHQLWQEGSHRDPPPGVLQQLASHGGADLARRWLEQLPTPELREAYLPQEVAARLALGDRKGAEDRIMQVSTRPGQSSRTRRQLVELADDNGLCDAVRMVGERLLADSDEYAHRVAVGRMLDCARRRQNVAEAEQIRIAVLANNPSPGRIDLLGRALVDRGFFAQAAQLWSEERLKRPLGEDPLASLARSLLELGRPSEAVPLLHQMVQVRRTPRTMLMAAEMLEDYGLLDLADGFYAQASALEPDVSRVRARRVALALRLRAMAPAGEQIRELAARGATAEDWRIVREMAERTGQVREVAEVLATLPDPDRDVDRLRLTLFADLGDREGGVSVLQRLRSRTGQLGAEVSRQLMELGLWLAARETAEDDLANAEPGGAALRRDAFAVALDVQPDKASPATALRLARLYLGRALDPELVAPYAAMELGIRGHAKAAAQLAGVASRDRDPRFAVLRGGYLWDSGEREKGLAVWREARAHLLLDPRLPELLRSWDGQPTHRFDELSDSLSLLYAAWMEVRAWDQAEAWLHELLAVVPTARWPLQRLTLLQLLSGRPKDAAQTLLLALDRLPELGDGFAELADKIAQEGGGDALLQGMQQRGAWLRTEPWVAALLFSLQHRTAGAATETTGVSWGNARWRDLAAADLDVQLSLAVALANAGQAPQALSMLGETQLCGARAREASVQRGVMATVIALQAAETHAAQWQIRPQTEEALDRILQCNNSPEIALALAEAAIQQGHPELAAWLAARAGTAQGLSPAAADRLTLTTLSAGSDDEATAALLQWVRGRRSQLDFPAVGPAQAPADLAMRWALGAGRPKVAAAVAAALRSTEPGLALPTELVEPDAPLFRRIHAADPTVWTEVWAQRGTLPRPLLLQALPLALALAPADAAALAEQMASRDDEPWRAWLDLYTAATSWEEPQVAEQALAGMKRTGAPAGVLACPMVAWQGGELDACVQGRQVGGLTEAERLDIAQGIARSLKDGELRALTTALVAAPQSSQHAMLQAMSAHFAGQSTEGQQRLVSFANALMQALPTDAARSNLAAAALDDLAGMGMAATASAWTSGQLQRHPLGQGSRNNAAYALFLAGQSDAALPLARPAAWATGADRSHAALDTLAAILHATGDKQAALAVQRRALAAALTRPGAPGPSPRQMGLPMARLSTFVLADGDAETARLLASTAVESGDDPSALLAARRAWKAAVRASRR